MTITNTWCEDCQEENAGHARLCTICGGTLTIRPSTTTSSTATTASSTAPSFRAMPDIDAFLPAHLSMTETVNLLRTVRQQVQETTNLAQQALDTTTITGGTGTGQRQADAGDNEWQTIPTVLLDPQNDTTTNNNKRCTAKHVLQKLPRETLHSKSSCLFHVSIQITTSSLSLSDRASKTEAATGETKEDVVVEYEGVTSELGPLPSLINQQHIESTSSNDNENTTTSSTTLPPSTNQQQRIDVQAPLYIPSKRSQRTAKEETFSDLHSNNNNNFIAIMERGHNITFYQKAIKAQDAGASAVIVINDKEEPWPYVMKDSHNLQVKERNITIPVVMISQNDGRDLLQKFDNNNNNHQRNNNNDNRYSNNLKCQLTIAARNDNNTNNNNNNFSCVICTDSLQFGQTILTLSNYCGHSFHENCALPWLQAHNTCPYCRRTLPTDDPIEEYERRRQITSNGDGNNGNNAFYS